MVLSQFDRNDFNWEVEEEESNRFQRLRDELRNLSAQEILHGVPEIDENGCKYQRNVSRDYVNDYCLRHLRNQSITRRLGWFDELPLGSLPRYVANDRKPKNWYLILHVEDGFCRVEKMSDIPEIIVPTHEVACHAPKTFREIEEAEDPCSKIEEMAEATVSSIASQENERLLRLLNEMTLNEGETIDIRNQEVDRDPADPWTIFVNMDDVDDDVLCKFSVSTDTFVHMPEMPNNGAMCLPIDFFDNLVMPVREPCLTLPANVSHRPQFGLLSYSDVGFACLCEGPMLRIRLADANF